MPEINATMVKELRERTGAGIMDCKTALLESGGDAEKAVEYIKKKGLAKAAKKAGAIAAEGAVHAYIHPGQPHRRAGRDQLPDRLRRAQRGLPRLRGHRGHADRLDERAVRAARRRARRRHREAEARSSARRSTKRSRPAASRAPPTCVNKIVDGRVEKWLAESCLDEQPVITDADKNIGALAAELSGKIGEKISVRRFVRYELGEGIEKKKSDLAAEVKAALAGD